MSLRESRRGSFLPCCEFSRPVSLLSPPTAQVLGEITNGEILILYKDSENNIICRRSGVTFGRDSNDILISVLGATERDEGVKKRLEDLEKMIGMNQLDEARRAIDELRGGLEDRPIELEIAERRLRRRSRRSKASKRSYKGDAPQSFVDWIKGEEAVYGEKPTFDTLRAPEKDELRLVLLKEQGFLCAYCGRSLSSDFLDSHVDHFWPQAVFNGRAHPDDRRLDHGNLFQSCGPTSLPGLLGKPHHSICGDAKNDWYNEQEFVIPSEEGCEERFVYDPSGRIDATNSLDRRALNMVGALELNHPALSNQRKKVIEELEQTFFSNQPDWREVDGEIVELSRKDEEGRQTGFAQVARRYLD